MNDIPKIEKSDKIIFEKTYTNPRKNKKKHQKKNHDDVKKHFHELTEMVHEAHQELEEKNSPYRFCIYQEKNEIFIDVITINQSGKTKEIFKHNITNDEFVTWIKNIKSGLGLVFDKEI